MQCILENKINFLMKIEQKKTKTNKQSKNKNKNRARDKKNFNSK